VKFACTIAELPSGSWKISHESAQVGRVQAAAATRSEALEKMRGELRYRLELCPCSGESYQHIEIEIAEAKDASPPAQG
jgi:hypothetical protein